MPVEAHVRLVDAERLAGGDAQLGGDEVDARHLLGDGVLDLQPRVHLHERELVRIVCRHDELDGASAAVIDTASGLDRRLCELGAQLVAEVWRGRLLDDLLVSPLQRALALAEVDDGAVAVGDDLYLDMAGSGDQPLEEESVIAERCLRLAPRGRERLGEVLARRDGVHALAAAACRGLHKHGEGQVGGAREKLVVRETRFGDARHDRDAPLRHALAGADLVAHHLERLDRWTNEHDPGLCARERERRLLGEEAVAWVDRLGPGRLRRRDDLRDAEVATGAAGLRAVERDGLVSEPHVRRIGVDRAVDGDRADAKVAQGPDNPAGDLAAVCNKY